MRENIEPTSHHLSKLLHLQVRNQYQTKTWKDYPCEWWLMTTVHNSWFYVQAIFQDISCLHTMSLCQQSLRNKQCEQQYKIFEQKSECLCLHLSSYPYNLIFSANQWSSLAKIYQNTLYKTEAFVYQWCHKTILMPPRLWQVLDQYC